MNDPVSPAWTVRQLAEYLSVNERTVYRMAERGDLPAFKVGDAWRFRRHDIDAWIDRQQARRSRSEPIAKRGRAKR
jgi:excisionase family DNA binding protein